MIRSRFEYHAPGSLDEALELLAAGGGAGETNVIGGGTWAVVEMTNGIRKPQRVIDLRKTGLNYVKEDGGGLVIGATATYTDVLDSAASKKIPALVTMASGITGGRQIRNRGTLGGSACYANPASDVPGILVGLGATMRLRSKGGNREVPASEFFLGGFESDVRDGELLTEIAIPAPASGAKTGYYKFKLCESSWPIVTGTAVVTNGTATIALGGAAATPVRFEAPSSGGDEVVRAAEQAVGEPWSDVLADGEYRKSIAGVIAKRALQAAS